MTNLWKAAEAERQPSPATQTNCVRIKWAVQTVGTKIKKKWLLWDFHNLMCECVAALSGRSHKNIVLDLTPRGQNYIITMITVMKAQWERRIFMITYFLSLCLLWRYLFFSSHLWKQSNKANSLWLVEHINNRWSSEPNRPNSSIWDTHFLMNSRQEFNHCFVLLDKQVCSVTLTVFMWLMLVQMTKLIQLVSTLPLNKTMSLDSSLHLRQITMSSSHQLSQSHWDKQVSQPTDETSVHV